MKRLLYSSFSICSLYISACETNNVSNTGNDAKAVGICCAELPAGRSQKVINITGKNKASEHMHDVSSVLPAYFWDTKSMNW